MKQLKPHFSFHKKQRNGVFFLLLFIAILQIIYFLVQRIEVQQSFVSGAEFLEVQLDSLEDSKRLYWMERPFNPNYISDVRGYFIGMSTDEIDRIFSHRKQGNQIKNLTEFKKVTRVSDSMLDVLTPLLRFPQEKREHIKARKKPKYFNKGDLNAASSSQLEKLRGIGPVLSKRIVKYRKLLGGFLLEDQLQEVYGLSLRQVSIVLEAYELKELPYVEKIDVNSASFKEVLSLVYIDYELTKKIVRYRDSVGRIVSLKELTKIEGFPVQKYDRIALYLHAK